MFHLRGGTYREMGVERFSCGYPEGIESLMAGKIKYGERFEDVSEQIRLLNKKQRDQLVLLVSCDRIYGFFEQRGGVANGPKLEQMVRELVDELEITPLGPALSSSRMRGSISIDSRLHGNDNRGSREKYYYDEMVKTGILEEVEGLGLKNVFCTVWNYINESLGY